MVYVAFLRGINVGGNSIVSMAALKETFERLKFSDVKTFINSGNVIFNAPATDVTGLTARIERAIAKDTGLPIKVLLRDRDSIKRLVAAIPPKWVNDTTAKCDVFLLWDEIDSPKILDQFPSNPDIEDIKYMPGAVVWHIDRSRYGKSKLPKIVGTSLYKQITIRNVNTIRKILGLVS